LRFAPQGLADTPWRNQEIADEELSDRGSHIRRQPVHCPLCRCSQQ